MDKNNNVSLGASFARQRSFSYGLVNKNQVQPKHGKVIRQNTFGTGRDSTLIRGGGRDSTLMRGGAGRDSSLMRGGAGRDSTLMRGGAGRDSSLVRGEARGKPMKRLSG